MTSENQRGADRLERALAHAAVQAPVSSAWTGEAPDPEVGQLWRVQWGADAELVILTAVAAGRVQAAPVTFDPDYADDQTAVLPTASSPLGVDLAVWIGLARELPLRVLDRYLGAAESAWRAPGALLQAIESGSVGRGEPLVSPADPRNQYRAHLVDTLVGLRDAAWAPAGGGTLAKDLRGAGIGVADLVALLDVSSAVAFAVLRGRQAVTAEQAERLVDVLHRDVASIVDGNPELPEDLVAALDHPRHRQQLRALAGIWSLSDIEARRQAAHETWALAARQSGRGGPVWDERLERYLDVTLGS